MVENVVNSRQFALATQTPKLRRYAQSSYGYVHILCAPLFVVSVISKNSQKVSKIVSNLLQKNEFLTNWPIPPFRDCRIVEFLEHYVYASNKYIQQTLSEVSATKVELRTQYH